MEFAQLFILMWFFLALLGRLLLVFRNDYKRISVDWDKIKSSGFFRTSTFYLACFVILPFSIIYSINNIRNQNK